MHDTAKLLEEKLVAAGTTAVFEGRRAVRLLKLLDSLVAPLIRGDAGQRHAWAAAKRMGRGRGGVVEGTVPETPTTPVVPSTPAVPATPTSTAAPVVPAAGVLSVIQTPAEVQAEEVAKAA